MSTPARTDDRRPSRTRTPSKRMMESLGATADRPAVRRPADRGIELRGSKRHAASRAEEDASASQSSVSSSGSDSEDESSSVSSSSSSTSSPASAVAHGPASGAPAAASQQSGRRDAAAATSGAPTASIASGAAGVGRHRAHTAHHHAHASLDRDAEHGEEHEALHGVWSGHWDPKLEQPVYLQYLKERAQRGPKRAKQLVFELLKQYSKTAPPPDQLKRAMRRISDKVSKLDALLACIKSSTQASGSSSLLSENFDSIELCASKRLRKKVQAPNWMKEASIEELIAASNPPNAQLVVDGPEPAGTVNTSPQGVSDRSPWDRRREASLARAAELGEKFTAAVGDQTATARLVALLNAQKQLVELVNVMQASDDLDVRSHAPGAKLQLAGTTRALLESHAHLT